MELFALFKRCIAEINPAFSLALATRVLDIIYSLIQISRLEKCGVRCRLEFNTSISTQKKRQIMKRLLIAFLAATLTVIFTGVIFAADTLPEVAPGQEIKDLKDIQEKEMKDLKDAQEKEIKDKQEIKKEEMKDSQEKEKKDLEDRQKIEIKNLKDLK